MTHGTSTHSTSTHAERAVRRLLRAVADDLHVDVDERVVGLLARLIEQGSARGPRLDPVAERVLSVLESGDLCIVYQPIRDLFTGETVGYEALSRFPGPPDQTPDRWFADAAALGLGVPLEVLAVRLAVGVLDALPGEVYLSVNVSPTTAMSDELFAALDGVPLDRLVLEITEHAEVVDYDVLNRAIGRLRAGGTRLAIDDTGSGFASMRHVLRLAPDVVKLDTTLTHDIDSDATLRALGYALQSFATAIDVEVVAEGVETEREMDTLRFLGVRYGQGYHLRRPGPLGAGDLCAVSPTIAG